MLKKIIKRFIRYCIGILKSFERSSTYVGQNLVLTKTIWGHKMYVSSHDLSLSPHLIIDGYWEEWITKQFRKICKPDMTVLDVGSNLGYYSLHAAELVGSSGRVHSFEANPNLHKISCCLSLFLRTLDLADLDLKAMPSVKNPNFWKV